MTSAEIRDAIDRLRECDGDDDYQSVGVALLGGLYPVTMLRDILIELLKGNDTDSWTYGRLGELGLVRLPKDKDGETIHAGDVVDCNGQTYVVHSIKVYVGTSSTCSYVTMGDNCQYTVSPDALTHHHHEPTVEELLVDFNNRARDLWDSGTMSELVTEYADKLKELMGDDQC